MRNNDNCASNFSTDLLALETFGMNAKSSTLVDLSSGSRIAKNNIWNIENSINIKNLVSVFCHFGDFMNFNVYIYISAYEVYRWLFWNMFSQACFITFPYLKTVWKKSFISFTVLVRKNRHMPAIWRFDSLDIPTSFKESMTFRLNWHL